MQTIDTNVDPWANEELLGDCGLGDPSGGQGAPWLWKTDSGLILSGCGNRKEGQELVSSGSSQKSQDWNEKPERKAKPAPTLWAKKDFFGNLSPQLIFSHRRLELSLIYQCSKKTEQFGVAAERKERAVRLWALASLCFCCMHFTQWSGAELAQGKAGRE